VDCLRRRIGGLGEVLDAEGGGAHKDGVISSGRVLDVYRCAEEGLVGEVLDVDGQVGEGDVGGAVGKYGVVNLAGGGDGNLGAVEVEARLPADQVVHVTDDHLNGGVAGHRCAVEVGVGVAYCVVGEAVVDGAEVHHVGAGVGQAVEVVVHGGDVGVAHLDDGGGGVVCGDHVEADPGGRTGVVR
jgi:hypothetical protein